MAASALLPLAPVLASDRPQQLAQLQASLWNILLDSNELSPATGASLLQVYLLPFFHFKPLSLPRLHQVLPLCKELGRLALSVDAHDNIP